MTRNRVQGELFLQQMGKIKDRKDRRIERGSGRDDVTLIGWRSSRGIRAQGAPGPKEGFCLASSLFPKPARAVRGQLAGR